MGYCSSRKRNEKKKKMKESLPNMGLHAFLIDCSLLEMKSHGSLCLIVPYSPHSCSCMPTEEKMVIYQSKI